MINKCPKCSGSKLVKRIGGMYAKCDECSGIGHVKVNNESKELNTKVAIQPAPNPGTLNSETIQRTVESVSAPYSEESKRVYKGRKQGTRVKTQSA